ADLSEHLSGPAVTDYPALANIPTLCWQGSVYHGKIYAIPQPRGLLSSAMLVRMDILEERGLPTAPESGDEFLEVCQELTNARKNQWALSNGPGLLTMLLQMYGVP